jgi:predicted ATPase
LLLVDNCEHVLDEVARVVSGLVAATEQLHVTATSRERLAITGEHVFPVEPLERTDAVELFQTRAEGAGATAADEEVASQLCARLDNLPLAIELAAARAPALPPALLLERLGQRLDLLRGPRDSDERQRTLRTTIAWSYDLLTDDEKRLFRATSLLAGGGTLAALEQIADADIETLESLVAKSLVRMAPAAAGPRYWMLETIREFASDQLGDTDEAEELRQRYVETFRRHAEDVGALETASLPAAALEVLETELGNLRMAFALALERDDDAVVPLGAALGELHGLHGRSAEAEEALREALARTNDALVASKLRRLQAFVLTRRNDLQEGADTLRHAEEVLYTARTDSDRWWREWLEGKLQQANLDYWRGDVESLERATRELRPYIEARGTVQQQHGFLHVLLHHHLRREHYRLSEETEQIAREVREVAKAAGDWDADFQLGFTLLWRGKIEEAESCFELSLADSRRIGDVMIQTRCLVYGAIARRFLGDVERVRKLDAEIAELDETFSYAGLIAANRSWLAWRDGDIEATERHGAEALAEWNRVGRAGPTVFQWSARFPLLAADVAQNRLDYATEHARVMLDEHQQPLTEDVRAALEGAARTPTREAFLRAIDLARTHGYT